MSTATQTPIRKPAAPPGKESSRVVLVGNPNVGKSVIFGFLTGRYVTVSNYPGTTVTLTRGKAELGGESLEVIDTPGVNSLIPMSEDEQVTRDVLLEEPPRAVIQVADAKNLRRSLLITSQLAEMGIPFVLDLNMNDEADDLGVRIDDKKLSEILGVPVVKTVAVRRKGFDELREAIKIQSRSDLRVTYPEPVEEAIEEMAFHLPESHFSKRSLAVMLLANDDSLAPWFRKRIRRRDLEVLEILRRRAASRVQGPLATVVSRARIRAVDAVVREVEVRPRHRVGSLLDTLGRLSMHPIYGVPVLLVVLLGMYQFVGVFGAGTAVDFRRAWRGCSNWRKRRWRF